MDNFETQLLLRQSSLASDIGRRGGPGQLAQSPSFVGQIFGNPTAPTTTGCYFSVHPVNVAGVEGESSPGVLSPNTSASVLVYVIGTKAPVAGENLVCRFIRNRWVAERYAGKAPSGGAPIPLPNCPCRTTPATIQMTPGPGCGNRAAFQAASLVYGPTPAVYQPLGLPANIHLSQEVFYDPGFGGSFQYYFFCYLYTYSLTRLFASCSFGAPYRDDLLYRWPFAQPGNTCTPFLLVDGYPTTVNPSCQITVTE